jgi:hypothetical protein
MTRLPDSLGIDALYGELASVDPWERDFQSPLELLRAMSPRPSRANPPAAPLAQPSHTGEHTASGGSTPPPVLSPESQHFETGQEH